MIYLQKDDIVIRSMKSDEPGIIFEEFLSQGWHPKYAVYETYYQEQQQQQRQVFVAEYQGNIAGYTTMCPFAKEGPFANQKIPEVCDFNVFERFREKGIGNLILDAAEAEAAKKSDKICLGVGLHHGYGSAQRMYIKRGYVPDGSGVWYQNRRLEQYHDCRNDDDLVLYLCKRLR